MPAGTHVLGSLSHLKNSGQGAKQPQTSVRRGREWWMVYVLRRL